MTITRIQGMWNTQWVPLSLGTHCIVAWVHSGNAIMHVSWDCCLWIACQIRLLGHLWLSGTAVQLVPVWLATCVMGWQVVAWELEVLFARPQ